MNLQQFSNSKISENQFNIRNCGINPNHWYVVARSDEIKDTPIAITLWKEEIVIYRNEEGKINALENRCPHRQVKLSSGKVIGNNIECSYHGWHFNEEGKCSFVPYLDEKQKLPTCQIKSYPIQELDGFIWLFLGDEDSNLTSPMDLPEWENLNYIASVAVIDTFAHYSYLIENIMDMYHGHLHDNYQAWASAKLKKVDATNERVDAYYEAQSYYKIDKIWSISQLFFKSLRRLHPEPLNVSYIYPHWASSLGNDFKIYCLFCPINQTHTKAYLIHFTSLNAFDRLHKLPIWFRRFIKNSLFNCAKKLLEGLIVQDIEMIEQEQKSFLENKNIRNYELNKTVSAVQKLIFQQQNQIKSLDFLREVSQKSKVV